MHKYKQLKYSGNVFFSFKKRTTFIFKKFKHSFIKPTDRDCHQHKSGNIFVWLYVKYSRAGNRPSLFTSISMLITRAEQVWMCDPAGSPMFGGYKAPEQLSLLVSPPECTLACLGPLKRGLPFMRIEPCKCLLRTDAKGGYLKTHKPFSLHFFEAPRSFHCEQAHLE